MEIYVSYKDYNWMMDFCERLLEHCAMAVNGTTKATFGEHEVDFKAPYAPSNHGRFYKALYWF